MKARYLGLFGAVLITVAAWGCASSSGTEAPPTSDDLRIDPPSGRELDKSGPGGASPSSFTTTETQPGATGGTSPLSPADGPECGWTPLPEIHLSLPSARPLASPALARAFVAGKRAPGASIVRPKEFLNYYSVRYPQASDDIQVIAEVAPGVRESELILQVAVQAPPEAHRPLSLVVVVDTSLSMDGESMDRAQEAVASMARALTTGDVFTLRTSSGAALIEALQIQDEGDVQRVIEASKRLQADGGELLGAALADAYQAAGKKTTDIARVVLITDGAARAEEIDLGIVAGNRQLAGIPLIGIGVGDALSYDGTLIDVATRVGGGASVYLDSVEEAPRVLQQRFDQIMDVRVEDVQISLTLPEYLRVQSVASTDLADSPTGLARSDLPLGRTMIFRQVIESCAAISSLPATAQIGVSARWKERGSDAFVPPVTRMIEHIKVVEATPQITKASIVIAFAEGLANVRKAQLEDVANKLAAIDSGTLAPELAGDPDLEEIGRLTKAFLEAAAASAPQP